MDDRDLHELRELKRDLRRQQLYLAGALAIVGLGTLAIATVAVVYGYRVNEQLDQMHARLEVVSEESRTRAKAMALDLNRQQRELSAIQNAASEDLRVIRDAHARLARLAALRDPGKELVALREANEALWSELARQRAELVETMEELKTEEPEAAAALALSPPGRFRLGETVYRDPREPAGSPKGFDPPGAGEIRRASSAPPEPGYLVIELSPEEVKLGEDYRVAVRLVNRSNRRLSPASLHLSWAFQGKNTGGDVPLAVTRVDPRDSALLYDVSGQWTPAHENGSVVLTAKLTLDGGASLENSLRW